MISFGKHFLRSFAIVEIIYQETTVHKYNCNQLPINAIKYTWNAMNSDDLDLTWLYKYWKIAKLPYRKIWIIERALSIYFKYFRYDWHIIDLIEYELRKLMAVKIIGQIQAEERH